MAGSTRLPLPRFASRRAVVVGAGTLVGAVLALAIWSGCSVQKHYGVLSFFFDGVPSPEERAAQLAAGSTTDRRTATVLPASAHSAFVERRCSECHGASSNFGFTVTGFTPLDSTICLECHETVLTEVKHLHGPVAAGQCLWCHDAHESRFPTLLAQASPTLCLGCHQFQMQRPPPPAAHQDLRRDCLECHRGHGGDARFFLKPSGVASNALGDGIIRPATAE